MFNKFLSTLSTTLSFLFIPPMPSLQNNKVRRFAFELKMQDKSTYLLAADSEAEMEEWINTLNKILHSSFEIAMQEKRNGDIHDGMCAFVWILPHERESLFVGIPVEIASLFWEKVL